MSELERRFAFADFVAEMRRRRVVRFALGYCAVAFVVLQLGEIVLPAFGLGDTGLRILVVLVVLGFPPGIALAWIFEFTREGIRRTRGGLQGMLPRIVFLVFTVGIAGGLAGWFSARGAFTPGNGDEAIVLEEYDPSEPVRSIAVLPLDDFSPDGGQAYFASALQEELTVQLSRLDWLRVASRTSVMQYEGTTTPAPVIGRELGVDALVEGSVTRSGDQVRITLQLIHAGSDSHIDAFRFDREMTDVLALQTEVAMAVVSGIPGPGEQPVELAMVTGSSNPDAQEAYLRGGYEFRLGTSEGYRRAVAYFQEAFQRDSSFAPALAGLAGARFLADIEDGVLDESEIGQVSDEAARALALDSASAEVREVARFLERNLPAEALAMQSQGSGRPPSPPGSPGGALARLDTAWTMTTTGIGRGLEEAVGRRILESDEEDPRRRVFAARRLAGSGRIGSAIEVLQAVVTSHPGDGPAWETLARSHASAGDVAAAVETMRRWSASGLQAAPHADAVEQLERAVESGGTAGYWSWQLDRLHAIRAEGRRVWPTSLAEASAGAGDREGALDQLREALETEDPRLMMLRTDPAWDPLRDDPAFVEIAPGGADSLCRFRTSARRTGRPPQSTNAVGGRQPRTRDSRPGDVLSLICFLPALSVAERGPDLTPGAFLARNCGNGFIASWMRVRRQASPVNHTGAGDVRDPVAAT